MGLNPLHLQLLINLCEAHNLDSEALIDWSLSYRENRANLEAQYGIRREAPYARFQKYYAEIPKAAIKRAKRDFDCSQYVASAMAHASMGISL